MIEVGRFDFIALKFILYNNINVIMKVREESSLVLTAYSFLGPVNVWAISASSIPTLLS